jgi:hypothetical protein
MAICEYRRRDCDTTFEALVRGGDTVTCPHCGGASLDELVCIPSCSVGRWLGRQNVLATAGKNDVTRRPALKGACAGADDARRRYSQVWGQH